MRLLDVLARLDARQLGHHAVQDIFRIPGLRHIERGHQPQLDHFGIAQIVETEQVGARLFERRAVALQLAALDARSQLARTVAQTLVQVGVQVVGQLAVLVHHRTVVGTQHELLVEAVAVGGHIVGIGDVVDGHRLRAVFLADPVGVGQVDADRRGGIAVAAEHRHRNDLGRNALHLLLAVTGIDGRMVLEPLRVLRNDLGAVAGLLVHEIDDAFPRRLASQRIAVILDKAVHEIDIRHGILHPADVIAVEFAQIARLVIADERGDIALLRLGRHGLRLFEPVDDLLDGGRIHAAYLPDALPDHPVLFDQLGIQAVGDRFGIVGVRHVGVELLDFGLRHTLVIVVRRSGDQVLAGGLVQARLVERSVENGFADLAAQRVQLAELLFGNGLDHVEQVTFGEFGHELVVRIVVMDAVGEPDLFQVFLQRLPLGRRAVALVILIHRFERAAHGKVVFEILVEQDVAAALGRFGQIIDQLLLLQRKLLEAGDFVTDDLDVVETVDDPRGFASGSPAARGQCESGNSHRCKRQ